MSAIKSDTTNVKLGVCRVLFNDENLGFTKGGVEVEIMSSTSPLSVDQLGDSLIDERLRGRMIKIKVPLAETSLPLLNRVIPGSLNYDSGGTKATGTITVTTNPANNETVIVNGVTFTFKTTALYPYEVEIGGTTTITATNLAAALNAYPDSRIQLATYLSATNVVTITYRKAGTEGNTFTLNAGTAGADLTLSGATLTGGTATTATDRVDGFVNTGLSLIATAKVLRLHPIEDLDGDKSEEITVWKCNVDGGMTFAYKLDDQRVYMVEFVGYPDPSQDYRLFSYGDPVAA